MRRPAQVPRCPRRCPACPGSRAGLCPRPRRSPSAPQPGGTSTPPSATKEEQPQERSAAATHLTTYGPTFAAGAVTADRVAHTSAHRTVPAKQAPVASHAAARSGGVLSGKAAVDSGTPRHGDAYAVTGDDRAPLRLLAGVAARAAADGTRDRHRDIPVFPG